MTINSNVFVENLKQVLTQFELPEDKATVEMLRLNRMKRRLALEVKELEENVAVKCYATYAFGLTLKARREMFDS